MIPTKKIESMAYQVQQAKRQLDRHDYDGATLWVCSVENTAIRWGPVEIKDLSTRAWEQIKAGNYEDAEETLDEIEDLLEELQANNQ